MAHDVCASDTHTSFKFTYLSLEKKLTIDLYHSFDPR